MRNFLLLISIIFIISCGSPARKETDPAKNLSKRSIVDTSQSISSSGRKFFEYDEIDHYHSDIEDEREFFDMKHKSKLDLLKKRVVLQDTPKDITDTLFIEKLEQIGYKKAVLDKSLFDGIDSIFKEKAPGIALGAACLYMYRDILIFKKNSKTLGTVKICFDCMAYRIVGTTANTDNFGQDDEYYRLKKILKK